MRVDHLFESLLRSETETDVTAVLRKSGYGEFSDKNWKTYGDLENNFGIFGAQQSDPMYALTEKVVNSVDAVLTKECYLKSVNPTSQKAPKTMELAAEQFFGVPNGNLARLTDSERTQLAERNISIVVSGHMPSQGFPSVMIIDNGEGQHGSNFKDTFLSLGKSNKLSIPFVQGTFNMGSTGALRFCGKLNYQLIASRRCPELADGKGSRWAFTLIRKRPPQKGEKAPRYEYLAPDGKILEFESREVLALPGKDDSPYKKPVISGSIIKLYEYKMPARTAATLDFFRSLSIKLWKIVVPVRIFETRDYRAHSLRTTLAGMGIRLELDKAEVLEAGFPFSFELEVEGLGRVSGEVCLFKKDATAHRWISAKEAIVYTVNGQAHASATNDFFRRDNVRLKYIARELLVNVDCSHINSNVRYDLFMADRSRLADGEEKNNLENALEDFLKKHDGLREWNERRKQEIIKKTAESGEHSASLFEQLVKSYPDLANLLGLGTKIRVTLPGQQPVNEFEGKRFPTFLKLAKGQVNDDQSKACPQNSFCRVKLLTDAENDYTCRAYEPGELSVLTSAIVKSCNLYNGQIEVQLIPPKADFPVGSFVDVVVRLTSPESISGYFEVSFKIKVISPVQKSKVDPGVPREPKSKFAALPRMREVYRDGWNEDIEIASDEDYVFISNDEDCTEAFINMDNKYVRGYMYRNPKNIEMLKQLHKFSATIIGMSLHQLVDKESIDLETRRTISNRLGSVVLPMVDCLGDLKAEL